MPSVGVREAAKQLGVSHPTLIKARKAGSLQFESDGTVDVAKAKQSEWWKKHQADRGEDKPAGRPPAPPPAGVPAGVVVRRQQAAEAESGVRVELEPQPHGGRLKRTRAEEESGVGPDGEPVVAKIELEKRVLIERAEKLRLENEVRSGKLVDRAEIESATETRFRADAEALMNWPARVKAQMAAELGVDDKLMHDTLDKYVRQFMSERAKASSAAAAG